MTTEEHERKREKNAIHLLFCESIRLFKVLR